MESTITRPLLPALLALGFTVLLLIIRAISFKVLHRWAKRTETKIDDMVIKSLRAPSVFWAIALGIYIGIVLSDLPAKYVVTISKIIHVLLILSVTIATANLSGRIFRGYIQQSSLPLPTTGLAYGLLKGIILITGFLIVLSVLGISITPLITALGVGGLAVALALQDTLANLFAGIHILVERSIRVGDFIRLETGQEGYVDDITWRTTRVRMLPNNIVVIPNSKLAQSVVTNYHLPEKRMSLRIPIGVSYSSDPGHVERVLVEEARKAAEYVPGLLAEPEPAALLVPGFGESSLEFTLVCQIREFADQYPVQHELRKRILKRFRDERIEIPFPHRTVYLREDRKRDR